MVILKLSTLEFQFHGVMQTSWRPNHPNGVLGRHRQFKSEVQPLGGMPGGTHRDILMFTTTTGYPYELYR
jgi:hypothetical protein